eukprot:3887873-Ditylum_brightwellii.AAC.1
MPSMKFFKGKKWVTKATDDSSCVISVPPKKQEQKLQPILLESQPGKKLRSRFSKASFNLRNKPIPEEDSQG